MSENRVVEQCSYGQYSRKERLCPMLTKSRLAFAIWLRSWFNPRPCAEVLSPNATSSAVSPAVPAQATPRHATAPTLVSREGYEAAPTPVLSRRRRRNWYDVRSKPANISGARWRPSGRPASNGPTPNWKVRRRLPRPAKKRAPNRPRSLGLAARAIEQRLNADLCDEPSWSVDCRCGKPARYVGRRVKQVQSVLGRLRLERAYYHCPG